MEISLKRFNGKIGHASNKTNNICQTRYQLQQKEEKRKDGRLAENVSPRHQTNVFPTFILLTSVFSFQIFGNED